MYADQPSGLAPDEITMTPWMGPYNKTRTAVDAKMEGLWLTHLARWQAEGGPGSGRENVGEGGDPPGVREVEPIREVFAENEREYMVGWAWVSHLVRSGMNPITRLLPV